VTTIDPDLLKMLCCPETHQVLCLAEPPLINQLNEKITAGRLQNRAGQPVKEVLGGGLVRADRKFLYPVRQGIPVMLVEEALPITHDS
jgi:uncharacterized protein YbaR (Trm112 family)